MDDLGKIDIIRERTGVSYRRARDVLDQAGGSIVEALVLLEEEDKARTWRETFQVQGSELVDRVRQLVREGNVHRVVVQQDGRTLLEVPVTVGAIGAVLMPTLAALGVVAALVTRCTILVERRGPAPGEADPQGQAPRGQGQGDWQPGGQAGRPPHSDPASDGGEDWEPHPS